MIHEVIAEVDAGAAVVVQEVELRREKAGEGDGDGEGVYRESLEELEERMHKVEHGLIVEGTRRVLERLGKERVQARGQQ